MFESMRIYIERDGRSYNYLPKVRELNKKREEELQKEEKDLKNANAESAVVDKSKIEKERLALENL